MSPRTKLLSTLGLVGILGGIGAADYYYSGNEYAALVNPNGSGSPYIEASTGDVPAGGVRKNSGPAVKDVIEDEQLESAKSDDLNILSQIVKDDTKVESLALLFEDDRIGAVAWVESPLVKNYFIALKQALLSSFSPQMKDLRDETLTHAGLPIRNILTFSDPALSEEKIVFVRVRERLYEFHVAAGKEDVMNAFIEKLTTR